MVELLSRFTNEAKRIRAYYKGKSQEDTGY